MLYLSVLVASLTLPLNHKFDEWKRTHSKTYATIEEEAAAQQAFELNDEIIFKTNSLNLTYTLGHNEFSDLTWEQFRARHMSELFLNRPPKNMQRVHIQGTEVGYAVPDAVDWVTKGAVTPVKNQGRCGSCWAFSTTGSVEGAYQIATGKLVSFSEEDLVQCDHNGDQGCHGGLMDNAFEWIETNGLATEDNYPYTSGTGTTGTCIKAKSAMKAVTITSFTDVPKEDEDAMKSAVAKQPVSVAIEADKSVFQLYKSGVLDSSSCGTKLDHGVLVVGYGTDSGKDYWKVKNSWGATWGESGYIRMARGKNMCGIAQQASYPKGAKSAGPSPPSPSPPSPTPPSPTPPGPAPKTHYGDPKNGCMSDESEVSIQGVQGDFCTPKCSFFKPCPTDVPTGVVAAPQCALQDSKTHDKFCALICSPTLPILDQKAADQQCGKNASCKSVQLGIGICTYDD